MLYNGENNGSLYLSVRDATDRLGLSDLSSVCKAFDELTGMGFIELTQDSTFSIKAAETSRARCWRLTWEAGPGGKRPNPRYLENEPEPKTKARKRMEKGLRALKKFKRGTAQNYFPVVESETFNPLRT